MAPETVVTVDSNKTSPQQGQQGQLGWIKININYFKTLPGILKLAQLVLGIICMACASPAFIGATHFFLFVAVSAFIATLLWIFVYLLSVREALKLPIHWVLTELLNHGILTVLYLIATIVQLAGWSGYSGHYVASNITAGVFGLINTIAYAVSSYFIYLEHKSSVVVSS